MDRSIAILVQVGVEVATVRAVDHVLALGVQVDVTEHGAERDDWPGLLDPTIPPQADAGWIGAVGPPSYGDEPEEEGERSGYPPPR